MRLVEYHRVSSEEQNRSGLGLEAQARGTFHYGAAYGHEIIARVIEPAGTSSTRIPFLQRVGGARTMALISSGEADAIIATTVDRFCRDTVEFLDLAYEYKNASGGYVLIAMDLGVDLTTAMGRFVATIMAAKAQLERDQTSERTVAALRSRSLRGLPLGSRAHKQPVVVSADAEAAIRALKVQGLTTREIARRLSADGYASPRGGQWGHSTVAAVLSR